MKMHPYCSTLSRVGYGWRWMHQNSGPATTSRTLKDTWCWRPADAEYLCAPMELVLLAAVLHSGESWLCVHTLSEILMVCSSPRPNRWRSTGSRASVISGRVCGSMSTSAACVKDPRAITWSYRLRSPLLCRWS